MAPGSLRGNGTPTLDPAAGAAAAQAVLTAAGVDGQVQVDGQAVHVQVRVTAPTAVLSMLGIDRVGGTGTATASPIQGMTGQEGQ